ncbi:MAG: tetratricopeptide repeat protein, partial [Bacteroidota bacterium]
HSWHAHHLANVLHAQGQHAEALRWYALSWDDERQASPSRSRRLAQYPLCHAHALAHLGRLGEARDLLEEGLVFAVADEAQDEYRAAMQSLDASGTLSGCAYAAIHSTSGTAF